MAAENNTVAVIGGGTMGADIAASFVACGWTAHIGMKVKKGFYDWTDESIAKEKARYEAALTGAMEILKKENAAK